MWSDLKQAVRGLWRARTLTLLAVVILGFGTGANTAVFSFVDALLFRPFPFVELDQLVYVWERHPQVGQAGRGPLGDRYPMTPADFLDVARGSEVFESVAAFRQQELTLSGAGEPVAVRAARVTPALFAVLRVRSALGRLFTEEEGQPGAGAVVLISDGSWKRLFGSDPAVVGREVVLDGRAHTIVGVMPKDFTFPLGGTEAWTPLDLDLRQREERAQLSLTVLGRLRAGTTLPRAQAALDALARRLEAFHPDTNAGRTFTLVRLRELQAGFTAPFAAAFQGSAAFVLLIACVNVGAVLAARAAGRSRELAVKAALGAGRWRLVRASLSESVVLSLLGGLLAVGVAALGIDVIRGSVPEEITRWAAGWSAIRLDGRALGFALAAALVTTLVAGLSPALLVGRLPLVKGLREGGRGAVGGPRRLFTLLVVGEMAAALVLVVGATLMVRGFGRLMDVYARMQPDGALVMELQLPETRYAAAPRIASFSERVLEEAHSLPGIGSAALVTRIPGDLGPIPSSEVEVKGQATLSDRERPVVDLQTISPAYFGALNVPVLRGRSFHQGDGEKTEPVAMLSESAARRLWPGGDAVGQQIQLRRNDPSAPWRTVVGVVSDVRHYFFDREPRSTVYLPLAQVPRRRLVLVARTTAPASASGALRARIAAVDPDLPLGQVRTLRDVIDSGMAFLRLAAGLLTVLGGVATVLSALGVYGVFAHDVAHRTQEIGVRVALGAARRQIVALVLRRVARLSAFGLGLGLPAAWAVSRVMSAGLFGIARPEPAALAALAAGLLGLALLAGYLPARKAAAIDPTTSLRGTL